MIRRTRQFWEQATLLNKRLMALCALIVAVGAAGGTLLGVKSWAQARVDAYIVARIDSTLYSDTLQVLEKRLMVLEHDSLKRADLEAFGRELEKQLDTLRIQSATMAAKQDLIISLLQR